MVKFWQVIIILWLWQYYNLVNIIIYHLAVSENNADWYKQIRTLRHRKVETLNCEISRYTNICLR